MARNLISLIDGTMVSASNTTGYSSYSNIFELACLLQLNDRSADGCPQIVFYTSGISSQPDNSSPYNLATGNSIKSQIVDQYTNICANFDFGSARGGKPDKIYLFGFSRGAMAIRALAGLIAEFGLLDPRDIRHLPVLLDRWDRTQGVGSIPDDIKLLPVEIEFIGLFDSVMGGVEWMSMFNPIRFSNTMLPARCRHGVQILAIDENRTLFKPKPWGGAQEARTAAGCRGPDCYLRQIWMPGVHADVGGTGNAVWGRASLLAMTFYLDQLTQLRLDPEWLREKEDKLRASIDDGRLFIRPHRGLLARFARRPSDDGARAERRHPIGERLRRVNYAGREPFDWFDKVLSGRFDRLPVDDDLARYFARVLDIGGKPAPGPPPDPVDQNPMRPVTP
jgi:uncharacterized protein (DUF2235 family)